MISAPTINLSDEFRSHKQFLARGGSVAKHVSQNFHPDARVLYVGNGIAAHGQVEIEALMLDFSKHSHQVISEKILSTVSGSNQVVEESLMTLDHTDEISWLLPGVKATGKEIAIVMITILTFDSNSKITSKKLYWDQASVLRQIQVLPRSLYCKANSSEVTLPISGSEIAYKVQDLIANVTAYSVEEAMQDMAVVEPLDNDVMPSPQRPISKRVNPNRGESDIFNIEQHPDTFRPSSRVLSRPGGASSDIFGSTDSMNAPASKERAHFKTANANTNFMNYENEPVPRVIGGKQHFEQPSDTVFEDDVPAHAAGLDRRDPNWTSNTASVAPRPSRPYSGETNKSSIRFGTNNIDAPVLSRRIVGNMNETTGFSLSHEDRDVQPQRRTRRDPNARSKEATSRPSSRVLANPGGKSSFSFA